MALAPPAWARLAGTTDPVAQLLVETRALRGFADGLVSVGRVSYGQYKASLGYKVRITRNMVANFNMVIRLDNNGLVARAVPMFGIGYSF